MTGLPVCLICGFVSSYITTAVTRYPLDLPGHVIAGALAGLVWWVILRAVIR